MNFCTARVAPEKAVFRPALPLRSRPEFTGERMAKMTYSEQLRHPNWQRKRLEVMEDAGFQCEGCGDKESTLNVHHRRYVKGRMAWEYERKELACLCEQCHQEEHEHRELLDRLLVSDQGSIVIEAIGLLGGYLDGDLAIDPDLADEARSVGDRFFDLGVLVSIIPWGPRSYLRIIDFLKLESMNPSQALAVEEWRRFVAALDASGL